MKKFLFLLAFMPLVLGGCEDKNGVQNDGKLYPVSGRTYIEEKYGGRELHFAKKGNSLIETILSEAGTKESFEMHFTMIVDTIHTYYNTTDFDTIGGVYIYHDTYLTSWWSADYRLVEQ